MGHLDVRSLRKSYGATPVVDGLSFQVERGAFVSLLGPSGSGKTTILRCLAGLETPDPSSGPIALGGAVLSGGGTSVPPERRGLGMVFQNYAVWPHLDVAANVAFPLALRQTPPAETRRRVAETLALVKLTGLERRYAHELSGGQQQRVALARALVVTPRLLLLDEPLSNLDALLREELGAEIRRLQRALDLTTILVTHDQKEALSLSDRILVLKDGRIAADGTPEALYADPGDEFVAQFLAGGQHLTVAGERRLYLPRRWRVANAGLAVRVTTRIFRGGEYEYLAEADGVAETLRFYGQDRLEMGTRITLAYDDPSPKSECRS